MKTVVHYMTRDLMSVSADCTIVEAVTTMRKSKIGSILVREKDKVVGIFTERDFLNKVNLHTNAMAEMKMRDVMTGNLKMAQHSDSYTDVMELMQRHNIRHMPVQQDGAIVGIVSLRDLSNHYYENLEHLLKETVAALSSAVEKRDPYTAGHQQRVAQLASAMAREMQLPEKQISGVNMAAVIHDVGKVYVPSEILTKPGKLTDAELTLIKIHPQVGYDILKDIEFPWPIAQIVLQHHERLDGSGYPHGIAGKEILFEAKIIGVADVVEAMSSHRPYRPALGIEVALKEIETNINILYDAQAVDACLKLFREQNFIFEKE